MPCETGFVKLGGFMERLKELREKKDLTRKQLGKLSGLSGQAIGKMETTGLRTLENIKQVAEVLGVHPAYLCGWLDGDGVISSSETVVEKVVEVPVYKGMTCIPSCWKPDENGQLIHWKEKPDE